MSVTGGKLADPVTVILLRKDGVHFGFVEADLATENSNILQDSGVPLRQAGLLNINIV